jgi:hypothetical protein
VAHASTIGGKMIFLFNQHWDIIPGKEEEYTEGDGANLSKDF